MSFSYDDLDKHCKSCTTVTQEIDYDFTETYCQYHYKSCPCLNCIILATCTFSCHDFKVYENSFEHKFD